MKKKEKNKMKTLPLSENEENKDKINEHKQFEHTIIPNLFKLWLTLNPSLQEVCFALV